jgi:xanthine dehydrogenase molybdenum-binding subunit
MMTGNAVKLAAEDARTQILRLAVSSLALADDPDGLTIENGVVRNKYDTDKTVTVAGIVQLPGIKVITGNGNWSITDKTASPRSVVVSVAEVAVDIETGKIGILNLIQGTDCGRAISTKRVEGQLDGVLSGGVGYMLMEDWAMDRADHGRILNLNLYDYKMPTSSDFSGVLKPHIIIEKPDDFGPFGARGMGEASLSASAPALLNAVYNAIGIRFNSTPLTPDRVLGAIHHL